MQTKIDSKGPTRPAMESLFEGDTTVIPTQNNDGSVVLVDGLEPL